MGSVAVCGEQPGTEATEVGTGPLMTGRFQPGLLPPSQPAYSNSQESWAVRQHYTDPKGPWAADKVLSFYVLKESWELDCTLRLELQEGVL